MLARDLRHDFTTVHALLFDGWMAGWAGDFAHARRRAEEGMQFAETKGFTLYTALARAFWGWARAELDEPEAGSEAISEGLAGMEATGAWMLHTFFLALLAEAQWRAGRPEPALVSVDNGLQLSETTGDRFYDAELHRLPGELVLALFPSHADESERELRNALGIARDQGAAMLETRAIESLRRLRSRVAERR